MQSRNAIGLAIFLAVGLAPRAGAQARAGTKATVEPPRALPPAPAIGRDSAKTLVLTHLRNATVISERLMLREKRQVYSFRVREKGNPRTVRVLVDATTGELTR